MKVVLKQEGGGNDKVLVVQIVDKNQEVIRNITKASDLGNAGKSQDAMNILANLQKVNKIQIQELNTAEETQPQDRNEESKD